MAENGMDHGSEKKYGQFHRRVFESNAALFAVGATIAILIGGIVEIVPMFTPAGPEHSDAITPYTPLEVAGRDIYVSEGCYLCHSQWVRPMRAEILRYGPWSRAWEYQYEVYYIRNQDPDDLDVPRMLSRRVLSYNSATAAMEFTTEDLAEGVEDLQLLFGYDSDNDGEVDTYKDPSGITDGGNWERVESVEVFMLVRSATKDAQYTDEKVYQLGDTTVGPEDDHYRRLMSHTSVSLRNLKLMIRGGA